ncbi:MAG: GNAT family N-acetyltransferase [Planctomycetaceae bacterium]|jgi:GNAT superfamily N-acetyltransferase
MNIATAQLVRITTAEQYLALRPAEGLLLIDACVLQQHRPDEHWAMIDSERVVARCSLWWHRTPPCATQSIGLIGHYAAATDEHAAALLEFACRKLAGEGCTLAVGPLDENTWRDYRFVTDEGQEPRYFLEPSNPPEWPTQFTRHGFTEFARYFSALAEDLSLTSSRMARVRTRMANLDVWIRPLCRDNFDADLRQIFAVAKTAFRDHVLYQDIGEAEFVQQIEALRSMVLCDLILLAEQKGNAVGFGFAVPDLLQAERGNPVDTVVIKTLGVLPGRRFAGLGQLLLEELQQRAASLGFRRAIHALVRETGPLQKLSRRYAVPFRRYTLFAKDLS